MAVQIVPLLAALAPMIPTIVAALGGKTGNKYADIAVDLLGKVLNKPGATKEEIEAELARTDAEKLVELRKLDTELKLQIQRDKSDIQKLELELAKIQGQVILEDSKSKDRFRTYWRPTLAWMAVAGLGTAIFLKPIIMVLAMLLGADLQQTLQWIPQFDTGLLMSLIIPLLGLGAYRSYEKVRGVR